MHFKLEMFTRRQLLPLTALLAGCLFLARASATELPVTLGDIETLPAAAKLEPVLKASLEQELKAADFGKSPFRKRYVLDASLVELASSETKVSTATCVISAMLRTKKDNQVVAVIRGRATAEGSRGSTDRMRREAVQGAVRSAVKKVPNALRETEGKR